MVVSSKEHIALYMKDKTGITVPIVLRDKIRALKKTKGEKLSSVIERLLSLYEKVEEIKIKKQNLTKNLEENKNGTNKFKQESVRAITT